LSKNKENKTIVTLSNNKQEKEESVSSSSPQSQLYFIMHVGPMKTGTSTIQCSLINLENQTLLPDNIVVAETQSSSCRRMIRKGGHRTINGCLQNWKYKKHKKKTKMPSCWRKLYIPYIKNQEKQNRSIIVSQENLSWLGLHIKEDKPNKRELFLNQLQKSIGPRYKIVVIITYRAFYDWVISYNAQHNKIGGHRDFDHWPDKGGKKNEDLWKYAQTMMKDHKERRYFADQLIQFYSHADFISVKLMDLDKGDIMKQFLCDSLPPSLNMCNLVDKISLDGDVNVAPDYLWCDRLAIKAHEKGMIQHSSKDISRKKVIFDIMDYQKELGLVFDDFPLDCPSQDFYDSLLKKSIELYTNVYYKNQHNHDINNIIKEKEEQYLKSLNQKRKKFCVINADEMLLNKTWIDFFNRYNSSNTRTRL